LNDGGAALVVQYVHSVSICPFSAGGDFRPLHRRALPAAAGQGSAVIPMISSKENEVRCSHRAFLFAQTMGCIWHVATCKPLQFAQNHLHGELFVKNYIES
jgi:hypothetical protein